MLIRGDARALPLADGCVDCVVTSPPYWGLRNYGSQRQIGLEPTFDAFILELLIVFREVWRALKPHGTCWVNLGDSYNTGTTAESKPSAHVDVGYWQHADRLGRPRIDWPGLKPKDLCMIPARTALALQADGWYLRSDIIWSKPNPMPESVTDRPTKAHEYVYLLTKAERYFYDADAIRESTGSELSVEEWQQRKAETTEAWYQRRTNPFGERKSGKPDGGVSHPLGRNKRSVWTIPTESYPEAHFATFPEALVEPCILAGSPLGGLVLDPFIGSGTTGAVAERLGRRWVGCDLTYHQLSRERTRQRGLPFVMEDAAGAERR